MNNGTNQRVAVVTGASAGIGEATAEALLRGGWRVIGTGRDPQRSEDAIAQLQAAAEAGGGRLDFLRGDFCEMKDVKRVAEEIKGMTDRLDILINNAGGIREARYVSSEGLEATMAANHFAPFLLTRELLPLLRTTAAKSAPGAVRVLAVSSSGHEVCQAIRWDDLMWEEDFTPSGVYCQAKLANLLFTRELNRREAGSGVVAQAMHPGQVNSNFSSHAPDYMKKHMAVSNTASPEQPAQTLVWMATVPEAGLPGSRYFHDRQEADAAPQALDDAAAARLWTESEKVLAGIGY